MNKTIQEGWTCTELAEEIKRTVERSPDDGRGRPVKIPSTLDGMLRQQETVVDNWEKRYPKIWSGNSQSFLGRAKEIPGEDVTEERLKEVSELAHRYRQMAEQVTKAADQAEEVVHRFAAILAERKTVDGQVSQEFMDEVLVVDEQSDPDVDLEQTPEAEFPPFQPISIGTGPNGWKGPAVAVGS